MADDITERGLDGDESQSEPDPSSAQRDIYNPKNSLIMHSIAIGIWVLLGITAGWREPLPPTSLSPTSAIIISLLFIILSLIVTGITYQLTFVFDGPEHSTDVMTFFGVALTATGAWAGIVFWGPTFAEMLREVTV